MGETKLTSLFMSSSVAFSLLLLFCFLLYNLSLERQAQARPNMLAHAQKTNMSWHAYLSHTLTDSIAEILFCCFFICICFVCKNKKE